MFQDFRKAFSQSFDPSFRWVFLKGVCTSIALLALMTFVVLFAANFAQDLGVKQFGVSLNQLLSSNPFTTMFGLSALVMTPLTALLLYFYRDEMSEAVEAVYYPSPPVDAAWNVPMTFFTTTRFLSLMLIWLLCVGLIYQIQPALAVVLFLLVNGAILAREFFYQIAICRMSNAEVFAVMRTHRWSIMLTGVTLAFLLALPIVNLMAGILAIAVFTHMINRLKPAQTRMREPVPEPNHFYSDAPLQDEPSAARIARSINHEKDLAAMREFYGLNNMKSDPNDPSTWANIFTDLAKP